jgi:phage baseplate assembly protein V
MNERDEDGAVLRAIYSAADLTPVQSADTFHLGVKDGASFEYNRTSHALQVRIPNGGSMTITVSGANVTIDAGGDVRIAAAGQIQLGGDTLKGMARLGDTVTCPAGTGTITGASTNVLAD